MCDYDGFFFVIVDEYITLNAKDSAYPTHASSHNQSEGNITPLSSIFISLLLYFFLLPHRIELMN